MTHEYPVAAEVAEAEFLRFAEEMDIDLRKSEEGDDAQKDRLIRAIQRGHLVINEDGEAVYTPHRKASAYKEPLTFHERTGATIIAADKRKSDAEKAYAMMADVCKVHPSTFAKLAGEDIKVCEAIFGFLMI